MTFNQIRLVLLAIAEEHYKELWRLQEDLETVLWKIKNLNIDLEIDETEE